ncbi:MAG: A24 family peptidase [Oscillospiraceae bacterium]|jgi:leader peptidase (prepilin peptidase)/N-methyltransferase|nr:A24 family peptidase [Oscillospiraceae bacterium]
MLILMCALALILNLISFYFLTVDTAVQERLPAVVPADEASASESAEPEAKPEKPVKRQAKLSLKSFALPFKGGFKLPSRQVLIFSVVMSLLCIGIAAFLSSFYTDTGFVHDLKRVCLLSLLWPAALVDYKSFRIPNLFILLGLAYRLLLLPLEFVFAREVFWEVLLWDVVASASLALAAFLCGIIIKNSIGFGDVKLFIVMGLMLGMDGIGGAVFVSLVVSFIASIFLLVTKKKKRKDVIPFAPALMAGTYISVFLTGM